VLFRTEGSACLCFCRGFAAVFVILITAASNGPFLIWAWEEVINKDTISGGPAIIAHIWFVSLLVFAYLVPSVHFSLGIHKIGRVFYYQCTCEGNEGKKSCLLSSFVNRDHRDVQFEI